MIQYNLKGGPVKQKGSVKGKVFFFIFVVLIVAAAAIFVINRSRKHAATPPEKIKKPEEPKKKTAISQKGKNKISHPIATPLDLKEKVRKAENALGQEKFKDAKKLADEAIAKLNEKSPEWEKAARVLSKANMALFNSDIPCKEKTLYTVQKGDFLQNIARKFNTTIAAIQKSNNMSPMDFTIHEGQTFCIYKGDWKIKVKKNDFKLYLYDGNKLFKLYDVGTGKQDRTPIGTFKITAKQANPTWYYKGKKYDFGSKENVLGTHWMTLHPTGKTNPGLKGYGIHGTWEPESIGKMSSNGCIRMKNEDVKELFSIVPLNTEVIIEN